MYKIFLVGAGGFVGAILRYLVSGYVQDASGSVSFPYGTFAVNIIGCFLIGIFSNLSELQIGISGEARLLIMVGLFGSFTTYSTFGNETLTLIQDQRIAYALANVTAHIILGLAAVMLGRSLVNFIWR